MRHFLFFILLFLSFSAAGFSRGEKGPDCPKICDDSCQFSCANRDLMETSAQLLVVDYLTDFLNITIKLSSKEKAERIQEKLFSKVQLPDIEQPISFAPRSDVMETWRKYENNRPMQDLRGLAERCGRGKTGNEKIDAASAARIKEADEKIEKAVDEIEDIVAELGENMSDVVMQGTGAPFLARSMLANADDSRCQETHDAYQKNMQEVRSALVRRANFAYFPVQEGLAQEYSDQGKLLFGSSQPDRVSKALKEIRQRILKEQEEFEKKLEAGRIAAVVAFMNSKKGAAIMENAYQDTYQKALKGQLKASNPEDQRALQQFYQVQKSAKSGAEIRKQLGWDSGTGETSDLMARFADQQFETSVRPKVDKAVGVRALAESKKIAEAHVRKMCGGIFPRDVFQGALRDLAAFEKKYKEIVKKTATLPAKVQPIMDASEKLRASCESIVQSAAVPAVLPNFPAFPAGAGKGEHRRARVPISLPPPSVPSAR